MYLLFWLVSPFHEKAKKWIKGRAQYFEKLKEEVPTKKQKRIWLHCASLGEFEQAKPIVESWLEKHPNWGLYVTFFSPSGYESRKNYSNAEWVGYFPLDTPKNAKKFLEAIQPDLVFFVKYEFWYFHLSEVIKRKIPLFLLSATFRKGHYIFKWHGAKTKRVLQLFDQIFVQDSDSKDLLETNGFTNVSLSGDSRYDRVYEIAQKDNSIAGVAEWKGDSNILILGSSWKEEEQLISVYLKGLNSLENWKVIIAPHDIKESHLTEIEKQFDFLTCSRYSEISKLSNVLIIDNIGMLSKLYSYADIAVVGGGFGRGLHNILEPLAHGVFTYFGPVHDKFPEAAFAIKFGVASEITDGIDYLEIKSTKNAIKKFVIDQTGATIFVDDFLNDRINEKY